MPPPPDVPPRIRTDASNAFAHHTMAARVPAIFERVAIDNADLSPEILERVRALAAALRSNDQVPDLPSAAPHAADWLRARAERRLPRWLETDWFFAEHYAYRQLVEATGYWTNGRDPFAPVKRAEYASPGHRAALEAALHISGKPADALEGLLAASLFGNRIDLSFAASLERGTHAESRDLLCDDRREAVRLLTTGEGPVHVVVDNAGTELSVDLVLVRRILEWLGAPVVLHLKVHPAFVSDALRSDVLDFIDRGTRATPPWHSAPLQELCAALSAALGSGRLELASDPFWNGPSSLWEMPVELERRFEGARLVVLKGDAHYRRAVGDAVWPVDTPFAQVTGYFPAPLLSLRTLKSDPLVGVSLAAARALDATEPGWRVNGQRGVASLGGLPRT